MATSASVRRARRRAADADRRRRRCRGRRARPRAGGRRSSSDLGPELQRRLLDGGAEDRPAAAAAGAEGVGRLAGVALVDGDRRRTAAPRCSATSWAVVVSRPWPCEPEPRYTSTLPSGWMRMCAGSVAVDAASPTAARCTGRCRCRRAARRPARLVASRGTRRSRPWRPPVRGSPRARRRSSGQADRQRVGQLVALQDVAPPQLERVDAQPPGRGCRWPVRGRTSRSATGLGTAPAGTCSCRPSCDVIASFGMRYGPVKMMAAIIAALGTSGYAPTSSRWSTADPEDACRRRRQPR